VSVTSGGSSLKLASCAAEKSVECMWVMRVRSNVKRTCTRSKSISLTSAGELPTAALACVTIWWFNTLEPWNPNGTVMKVGRIKGGGVRDGCSDMNLHV